MEFRTIPSLENRYEISCDGKILRHVERKQPRKFSLMNQGYFTVIIKLGNGKIRHCLIAHLVAEAWLGERPAGCVVDHIDRNKLNNHADNLRYVTQAVNMANCEKPNWFLSVTIRRGDDNWTFRMRKDAATFLAAHTSYAYNTCHIYLGQRKTQIGGFNIIYG